MVLRRIEAAGQAVAAGAWVEDDAGIVAGGDGVAVQGARLGPEGVELDELIAADAGVRRAPLRVLVVEVVDDPLGEDLLEVEDIVGDAQQVRHLPCVLDGGQRAACIGAHYRLVR